jgi:hypothetical protein
MGLLESTVSTNGFTNVIAEGLLSGLNTNGANAGDPVWLGTDGNLIYGLLNKPLAPAHLVFIGVVTRANANNGEIFVKVQNGFELDELHDLSVKNASDGDMIKYVASTGLWTKIAASTTNIVEGTNLYYTQGRFDTAFAAKSTTNLTEGTNLYYTTARVNSDFDTRLATKSTTNLSEGTNLYYTDARVGTYLTNNSYATQTYVNTAVSNLVDAAPGTLDTLNELAAALGDDPNFATTVATSIGTKVPNTRTITINGTSYDLSADRSWTINSMVYPGAGIAVSTGSAWGTSITDNSTNWNTAYGWGNHASAGYLTGITSSQVTTALGYTPYNSSNPSGYISSYTETDTLASVTARGASTSTRTTFTEVGATREGSDSVAVGPWFRWTNVAESRQMLTQLNASFGLTTWAYNGSAWLSAMTLTQGGVLSTSASINAGDSITLQGELYFGSTLSNRYFRLVKSGTAESAGVLNYQFYTGSSWVTKSTLNSSGNVTYAGTLTTSGTITGNGGATHSIAATSSQRYIIQALNTSNSINSAYGWWWFHNTNGDMGFHADGVGDILNITRGGGATLNGNTILSAGNYSSYSLPLSGGTMAGDITLAGYRVKDLTSTNRGIFIGNWGGAGYWGLGSTSNAHELKLDQVSSSTGAWEGATDVNLYLGSNRLVLHSSNYSSYALPLSGGTVSGTTTFSIIKGDSSTDSHSFTNTDSGNTYWTNRGGRLLTSNGTNWAGDGKDPIIAIVGNSSSTARGQMIGLTLHNDNNTDNAYSPLLAFSVRSNSTSYNTVYASIMGKKTGYVTGVDTNWAKGELHFFAHGDSYVNDIPTLTLTSSMLEMYNGDIKVSDTYRFGWRYTSGDSNMYNWIGNSYSSGILYRSGSWTSSQSIVAHDMQTYTSGWQSRLSILQNGLVTISSGSKIVVQNGQSGGTDRGIFMWNSSDANWGIYMATGGSTSMGGGTTCNALDGSSSHAIRFRIYSGASNSFIWENHSDSCLMSLGADASGNGLYVKRRIRNSGGYTLSGDFGFYTSYTSDGLWGGTATPNSIGTTSNGGRLVLGYQDNGSGLYSPAYGFEVKSTDGRPVGGQVVKAIVMKDVDTGGLPFYINNNGSSFFGGSMTMGTTSGSQQWIRMGIFSNSQNNGGEAWIGRASDRNAGTMTVQLGGGTSSSRSFEVVDYAWSVVMFSVNSANGNVTASGDVTAYSDVRVKENIVRINSALNKIKSINGYYFNRTDIPDKTKKIGFIAQEVLDVVPEIVNYNTEQDRYSISYGNAVALLVEGIKEQQNQIEELKVQNDALKEILKRNNII